MAEWPFSKVVKVIGRSIQSESQSPNTQAWRWCWALMLVLHGPALASSFRAWTVDLDPSRLISLLGMAGSCLFFILKMVDVPCLRFAAGRRTWITLALCIVLLHADAIERRLDVAGLPKEVPVAATLGIVASLNRVQRWASRLWARTQHRDTFSYANSPLSRRMGDAHFVPHRWILFPTLRSPRAPPLALQT